MASYKKYSKQLKFNTRCKSSLLPVYREYDPVSISVSIYLKSINTNKHDCTGQLTKPRGVEINRMKAGSIYQEVPNYRVRISVT